jgi:integral membrane sensor domain MASE1
VLREVAAAWGCLGLALACPSILLLVLNLNPHRSRAWMALWRGDVRGLLLQASSICVCVTNYYITLTFYKRTFVIKFRNLIYTSHNLAYKLHLNYQY